MGPQFFDKVILIYTWLNNKIPVKELRWEKNYICGKRYCEIVDNWWSNVIIVELRFWKALETMYTAYPAHFEFHDDGRRGGFW